VRERFIRTPASRRSTSVDLRRVSEGLSNPGLENRLKPTFDNGFIKKFDDEKGAEG
jgi:hypothetical protein